MEDNFENNNSILEFVNACNEFVEGKFILADIKIAKILRAITESEPIYNMIAECMVNYNFDKEFDKALVKTESGIGKFKLPAINEQIIPLVFCLLVEFDSKKINFNEFIKSQFPMANNQNEEYAYFAKNIIVPFRNAVAEYFGIEPCYEKEQTEETLEQKNIIDEKLKELQAESTEEEEVKMEQPTIMIKTTTITPQPNDPIANAILSAQKQREEDEEVDLLFNRIERIVRILEDKLNFVRNPLKKSNISLIIDALYEACEVQNVKIIVALTIAINDFAGTEKIMRNEIKELNAICYGFYA